VVGITVAAVAEEGFLAARVAIVNARLP
jgi:hypothetical protein